MAGKKSIIDLLPRVDPHSGSSDLPFRFNRHITGDYLATPEHSNNKGQKQNDLVTKIEKAEKPIPLVPPAGVPPPTAEQLMKLKKSQPDSVVDYGKPVEYQFLPLNQQEVELSVALL